MTQTHNRNLKVAIVSSLHCATGFRKYTKRNDTTNFMKKY